MVNGVERQLGVLIGQMGDVVRRLDHADESRSDLHLQIGKIGEDLAVIKASNVVAAGELAAVAESVEEMRPKVEATTQQLAAMKPEIDMVRNIKAKAWGAILAFGAIGGLVLWIVTPLVERVRDFVVGKIWP